MNFRNIAYRLAFHRLCPLMQFASSGRVHSEAHRARLLSALSRRMKADPWSLEIEHLYAAIYMGSI